MMLKMLRHVFQSCQKAQWMGKSEMDARGLIRELQGLGFHEKEVDKMFSWLLELAQMKALESPFLSQHTRVLCYEEKRMLEPKAQRFLYYSESLGLISPEVREIVLQQLSALGEAAVSLNDLKLLIVIVLSHYQTEDEDLLEDESRYHLERLIFMDPPSETFH